MKTIQIKDKQLKLDIEEYDKGIHYKWYITKSEVFTKIEGKKVSLSKLLFSTLPGYLIWHKNGDSFDFTRDNIMIISRSEFARYIKRNKKSKYHNVHWDIANQGWMVNIDKDGNRNFGGRYSLEEEAAIVADYLNIKIYSNNIKSNFKRENENALIEAYNKIVDKYGESTSDKNAISRQGVAPNKAKSSKFVGVSRYERKQKWTAEIRKNKKRYFLGYHDLEIEAAKAYDKKALELYGEGAKLNFPKQ